jgi:hypothetical protein
VPSAPVKSGMWGVFRETALASGYVHTYIVCITDRRRQQYCFLLVLLQLERRGETLEMYYWNTTNIIFASRIISASKNPTEVYPYSLVPVMMNRSIFGK